MSKKRKFIDPLLVSANSNASGSLSILELETLKELETKIKDQDVANKSERIWSGFDILVSYLEHQANILEPDIDREEVQNCIDAYYTTCDESHSDFRMPSARHEHKAFDRISQLLPLFGTLGFQVVNNQEPVGDLQELVSSRPKVMQLAVPHVDTQQGPKRLRRLDSPPRIEEVELTHPSKLRQFIVKTGDRIIQIGQYIRKLPKAA